MDLIIKALEFYRDGFEYHPKRSRTGINLSEWKPKQALLEDCGNLALEALEAARSTRSWQPIEAAPQDGRDLLLTSNAWNGDVVVGSFCFEAWRERPDPNAAQINPTHWVAYPEPPSIS